MIEHELVGTVLSQTLIDHSSISHSRRQGISLSDNLHTYMEKKISLEDIQKDKICFRTGLKI